MSESSNSIYLFLFCKKKNQPREHRLGEAIQGRSKSKFNIILSYLIVMFFLGNQKYLEIKKDIISKFLAQLIQNILIGNFQTS